MATFAETMLAKYQALLEKCAGKQSISVDGETVTISDLEEKYSFWDRRVRRQKRQIMRRIRMI